MFPLWYTFSAIYRQKISFVQIMIQSAEEEKIEDIRYPEGSSIFFCNSSQIIFMWENCPVHRQNEDQLAIKRKSLRT